MKFSLHNKILASITTVVAILTLISLLIGESENLLLQILRIAAGSVFILFLPGYFLTLAFFRHDEIDLLERFALSFALSISVVPLLTFYANLVGLPISGLSVFMIVLSIIISTSVYLFYQQPRTPGIQPISDGE